MKFLPIIIMNKTGNPIILTQADLELLPKLSEMVFAEDAWALFSKIISKNDNFLTDLLKANASNITLYYFQKAMKYQNVAQDFLDQTCPTHLTIDDLNNPYAKAIYSEALDRKIKVKALKKQKRWKSRLFNLAWFINEMVLWFLDSLRQEAKVSNFDVLFCCNVARQFDVVIPFAFYLDKKMGKKICILSKKSFAKNLSNTMTQKTWKGLRRGRYYFLLLYHYFSTLWTFRVSLLEWENQIGNYLTSALDDWRRKNLKKAIRIYLISKRILSQNTYRSIVVTDPSDFEARSLCYFAKKEGVPTLCIQYGLASTTDTEWKYFIQDYVGVIDQANAEILAQIGVEKQQIVVTGNPRFDSFISIPDQARAFREKNGLSFGDKLVAFMSVPYLKEGIGQIEANMNQENYMQILKSIYEIPNKISSVSLVVKPHPEELLNLHRECLKSSHSQQVKLIQNTTSFDVINAADFIITTYSTTGLEAIYLNKPLLMINYTKDPDLAHFAKIGVAIPIRNPKELILVLEKLLSKSTENDELEKKRKIYLEQYQGTEGFKSSRACANLLNKMISNHKENYAN